MIKANRTMKYTNEKYTILIEKFKEWPPKLPYLKPLKCLKQRMYYLQPNNLDNLKANIDTELNRTFIQYEKQNRIIK